MSPLIRRALGPIVLAVAVQSVGNLVFHGLVGRWLTPGEYGALGTLLAATTALAVPLGAVQTAAADVVARHGATRATARARLVATGVWTGAGALALAPLAGTLAAWWRLDSPGQALLVLPYALVSAVLATARGLLLGCGRVTAVAVSYVTSTVARLAVGLALTPALGVDGAILATVAGEAAALVLALVAALRACAAPGPAGAGGVRHLARSAATVGGVFLLSTVDLLLARHYLGDTASGAYVAAATIGKTVLALPAAVLGVLYPTLVRAWPGAADRPDALRRTTLVVCGTAAAAASVVLVAPALVLAVLYGPTYADQTGLARALATIAAVTSGVSVLAQAGLARRGGAWLVPWVGGALEAALVATCHRSPLEVALCSAAATVPTLAVLLAVESRQWRATTTEPVVAPAP